MAASRGYCSSVAKSNTYQGNFALNFLKDVTVGWEATSKLHQHNPGTHDSIQRTHPPFFEIIRSRSQQTSVAFIHQEEEMSQSEILRKSILDPARILKRSVFRQSALSSSQEAPHAFDRAVEHSTRCPQKSPGNRRNTCALSELTGCVQNVWTHLCAVISHQLVARTHHTTLLSTLNPRNATRKLQLEGKYRSRRQVARLVATFRSAPGSLTGGFPCLRSNP